MGAIGRDSNGDECPRIHLRGVCSYIKKGDNLYSIIQIKKGI